MRDTKLIFVEGLPGLGKSSTASWLASRLQAESATVNLFLEYQPEHPLNVGGSLLPAGDTPGEMFFQRYTPASFAQESLQKWEGFVHRAMQAEAINVLDSYPFQNTIRLLLQMNASFDFMQAYLSRVEALVAPLQPVLVYFAHRDVAHAVRHFTDIGAQRGKLWTEYVAKLVTHCPYGVARHLEGFGGVLAFISEYKEITDVLVRQLRLPQMMLGECTGRWEGCYRQIETFMGLSSGNTGGQSACIPVRVAQ